MMSRYEANDITRRFYCGMAGEGRGSKKGRVEFGVWCASWVGRVVRNKGTEMSSTNAGASRGALENCAPAGSLWSLSSGFVKFLAFLLTPYRFSL